MKKIKEYLKNKNPYLLASAVIVVLSIGLIVTLLYGESEENERSEVTEVVWKETQESVLIETKETETIFESNETEIVTEESEWKEEAEETIHHGAKSESLDKTDESNEQIEMPEEETVTKETFESTIESVPENDPDEDHDETLENAPVEEPDTTLETEPSETPAPEDHEHSWIFDSFYQEPTCSNGGLVNQICAHCGATQTTGGVPTGAHSYETETPGDCCSAEVVICTDCNHREVREKDVKNHIDVEDGFCYGCGQKTE